MKKSYPPPFARRSGRPGPAQRIIQSLRHLRENDGLTQDVVAGRLGLERSVLANYEQGKREPSLNQLVAWARALGTSLADLAREAAA